MPLKGIVGEMHRIYKIGADKTMHFATVVTTNRMQLPIQLTFCYVRVWDWDRAEVVYRHLCVDCILMVCISVLVHKIIEL